MAFEDLELKQDRRERLLRVDAFDAATAAMLVLEIEPQEGKLETLKRKIIDVIATHLIEND